MGFDVNQLDRREESGKLTKDSETKQEMKSKTNKNPFLDTRLDESDPQSGSGRSTLTEVIQEMRKRIQKGFTGNEYKRLIQKKSKVISSCIC